MSWYAADLTTLAFIWELQRSDGVALGFTSHDRDLVRGDLRYSSAPGMLPSAVRLSEGFDVDDVELGGALTSTALTADDLASGRWDGARLTLSAVDWTDPAAVPLRIVRGTLGAVSLNDDGFSVALRGVAAAFDGPVSEETSPSCRAVLGDRRCRVDLRGRRRAATVSAAAGNLVTLSAAVAADGVYDFGTLRWADGNNAGLTARILQSVGTTITLAEAPPMAVSVPVAVELLEGCDRQFTTCQARFGNAINFQGEPHLPGNDLLTRYGA